MSVRIKLISTLIALSLTACGMTNRKDSKDTMVPDSRLEAGTVNISAYPATPWVNVSERLRPNFSVKTASELLGVVVPLTTSRFSSDRTATAVEVAANFGGSATNTNENYVEQTNTNSAGVSSTAERTLSRSRSRTSGDIPQISSHETPIPNLGDTFSHEDTTFAIDPFLQYRAATALYQEIQLLNQYLSNKLDIEGFTPFLFRAQIAVHPFSSGVPFDVYSELSVQVPECAMSLEDLAKKAEARGATNVNLRGNDGKNELWQKPISPDKWHSHRRSLEYLSKDTSSILIVEDDRNGRQFTKVLDSTTTIFNCGLDGRVKIIPLIITDNVERTSGSQLTSAALQLRATMSALVNGVGVGSGISNLKEILRNLEGHEISGLLSVAQPNDKLLTVRIGASRAPNSTGYSMIGRTYDITFVALWPNFAGESATLEQYAWFRDARTGRLIPTTSRSGISRLETQMNQHLTRLSLEPKCRDLFLYASGLKFFRQKTVNLLTQSCSETKDSNIDSDQSFIFDTPLKKYMHDNEVNRLYWMYQSQTQGRQITVSVPKLAPMLPPNQNAVITDSGKGQATLSLPGSKDLGATSNLAASLLLNNSQQIIASTSISINADGLLTFLFPSPTTMGMKSQLLSEDAKLILKTKTRPGSSNAATCEPDDESTCRFYKLTPILQEAGKDPDIFSVRFFPSKPVAESDGKALLRIVIDTVALTSSQGTTKPAMYQILIDDNPIYEVKDSNNNSIQDGTNFKKSKNAVLLSADEAFVELTLKSVSADSEIKVTITALDSVEKPIMGQSITKILKTISAKKSQP